MILLTQLAAITVGIILSRNLFVVVVLSSAYSFLMATVMVVLDAVDVAMTEAAVGAGVSTVLVLSALALTRTVEAPPRYSVAAPLLASVATGGMLVYGTWGLPGFGSAASPVNTHVGASYLERNMAEMDIPNAVTSVLASYRGFDTLGETAVIFTAGVGVLLLLRRFGES